MFCNSFVNFEDRKMVDHILKFYDIRCLSWNTEIIVLMKKCRMFRRWYKSRHWIPMFIGTPCTKRSREMLILYKKISIYTTSWPHAWNRLYDLCLKFRALTSSVENKLNQKKTKMIFLNILFLKTQLLKNSSSYCIKHFTLINYRVHLVNRTLWKVHKVWKYTL